MKGVRMYDTETGRFTTPDLLWAAFPSHTPYHYAYNSPLIWNDPSGLAPEKERDREKLMGGEESGPIYSNPLMPKFQLELNAIRDLQLKWMGQSNNDFIAKYQSDDKDATRLAENNAIWTWATSLPATVNGEFKNVHNVNFIYSESKVRFTGDRYRGSEVLGYITGTKIEIDAQGHINFFTVTDASRSETLLWLHSIMKSGKRIDISFGNHGTNVFNYSNKNLPIVKIDESSLSNSQNKYWSISGNRIRFTIEQILAHEFLGHALDWVNGNHPDIGGFYSVVDLESWAIYVENVVIKYMGGEPRDCYNCWHHKTIFFRLFHKNPNWEIYKIK